MSFITRLLVNLADDSGSKQRNSKEASDKSKGQQHHIEITLAMQKRLLVNPAKDNGSKQSDSETTGAEEGKGEQANTAQENEKAELVDLRDLNRAQRQQIVDNALATNEQSNEVLLDNYAQRADK